MILSGIQIFKNLDSRCNHAGMTYYLGRENDILFLVFQKHELLHLFRNGSLYATAGGFFPANIIRDQDRRDGAGNHSHAGKLILKMLKMD